MVTKFGRVAEKHLLELEDKLKTDSQFMNIVGKVLRGKKRYFIIICLTAIWEMLLIGKIWNEEDAYAAEYWQNAIDENGQLICTIKNATNT